MINYKGLKNKEITVVQYPGGKLSYSNGRIKEIEKYEITHLASTEPGSSGSPIFIKDTIKVIGIHKSGTKDKKENFADLIGPIFNFFSNLTKEKGKIEYEDGKYYIGEILNGKPHGKGIKYNKNGNIIYEGECINGKAEGNGKYIYEDGSFYIGEWKNDLKHGKGIEYYKNGNIKYDGYFIDGKYEGNGKYIDEDGEYYIGEFKNGLCHGKGILYYKNGNIKYDGGFIDGKPKNN